VVPYLTLMTEAAPQRDRSLRELFNAQRYVPLVWSEQGRVAATSRIARRRANEGTGPSGVRGSL
jgi:hypothetical protein